MFLLTKHVYCCLDFFMRTKSIYILIAGIIVLIGMITLSFELLRYKKVIVEMENQLIIKEVQCKKERNNTEEIIKNFNQKFQFDLVVTNINLEKVYFRDRIDHEEKLCLFFTESMCSPCVNSQLDRFNRLADQYGTEKLCLLISLKNAEGMLDIKRRYNTGIDIYHIDDELIPFKIDNKPLLFVVNKSLQIKACYVVENGISVLNETYYRSINSIFSTKN